LSRLRTCFQYSNANCFPTTQAQFRNSFPKLFDRYHAQRAIKISHLKYHTIFHHGPHASNVTDVRGWITFDEGVSENNRRAKFYALTPKGRKQLQIETGKWDTLARAVARILRPATQEE